MLHHGGKWGQEFKQVHAGRNWSKDHRGILTFSSWLAPQPSFFFISVILFYIYGCFILHIWVFLYTMCMLGSCRGQRCCQIPELELQTVLSCGSWELKRDLLEKQPEFLTVDPSLQLQKPTSLYTQDYLPRSVLCPSTSIVNQENFLQTSL